MYPEEMTAPMKQELTKSGVTSLDDSQSVENFMKTESKGKVIFVNSVCGCSSRTARPGFIMSLKNKISPSQIGTVFAGVDGDATEKARSYINGYPPSSPSLAFFRDNQLVYFLERSDMERSNIDDLSKMIATIYDKFFGKEVNEEIKIKSPSAVDEITVEEVKEQLGKKEIQLIDCRTPEEREVASIDGSILLTEESLSEMQSWDKNTKLVVYCHHGNRSKQAVLFLKQYGFSNLHSMEGGIDFWSQEIDSNIPRY